MSWQFSQYDSIIAKVHNPSYERIENDKMYHNLREMMEYKKEGWINSYKNPRNISEYKTIIQHDSFFGTPYLQHFIANTLSNTLFTSNLPITNDMCLVHNGSLNYYKPQLVIHEIVERYFVSNCSKDIR